MLQKLKNWFYGENIEVIVIGSKYEYLSINNNETLVKLPDNSRRYINGHIGSPGEKITVNTWDLRKY